MPMSHAAIHEQVSKFFRVELKYKDSLFLQRNSNGSHTSYGKPFNRKLTFLSLITKAIYLSSLLSGYFVVHVYILILNGIAPILQYSTSMPMYINQLQQTSQQAFAMHYKWVLVKIQCMLFMASMLLTPFTVNGSYIITLLSVFVQGI